MVWCGFVFSGSGFSRFVVIWCFGFVSFGFVLVFRFRGVNSAVWWVWSTSGVLRFCYLLFGFGGVLFLILCIWCLLCLRWSIV